MPQLDQGPPSLPGFVAVVPAGGAGTRLWPLSRAASPKFLHDLTGTGRTLLEGTWDRLVPLTGAGGIMVVTGASHAEAVSAQLPGLRPGNLLTEPSPRDSMAAIGLAAAVLVRRDPEVVIGSFAADHVIGDVDAFAGAVAQAVAVARDGFVVTIGIQPTSPSTGFGYVRAADRLQVAGAPDALSVAEFVEKPAAAVAEKYLDSGEYLWNAGMFIVRAATLLDHLRRGLPALHDGLVEIAAGLEAGDEEPMGRLWPGLTRIAIDHAIAEPVAAAGGVAVVPGSFGWDDVGDWSSLAAMLASGDDGPAVLGEGEVLAVDSDGGVVVAGSGRAVAVLGLPDAVVIDTRDAVLVTTRRSAQQVKALVERLKAQDRTDLV